MIDSIVIVIITIVLFILIGTIMYFIYDYFSYKNNVDKSIKISTDHANKTVVVNNSNIVNSTAALESKYDTLISGLSYNISEISSNNLISSNQLINFDSGFNNYFTFEDNDNPINKKLYEYNFADTTNLNLDILSKVNAISGIKINSTNDYINDKNFRICSKTGVTDNPKDGTETPGSEEVPVDNNCVNLNVTETGEFNLTPDGISSLTINGNKIEGSENKFSKFAKFDFNNNDIYLGGDGSEDYPGTLRINNNDLYIKDLKLINSTQKINNNIDLTDPLSDPNNLNNITNFNTLDYTTIQNINSFNTSIMCSYSTFEEDDGTGNGTSIKKIKINMMPFITIKANSVINVNLNSLPFSITLETPLSSYLDYDNLYISGIQHAIEGPANNLNITTSATDINPRTNISFTINNITVSEFTNGFLIGGVTSPTTPPTTPPTITPTTPPTTRTTPLPPTI